MVRKKITDEQKRHSQILRRRSKNGDAKFELLVRRTGQHIYADLLDLTTGNTLTTVSTISIFKEDEKKTNREASSIVGQNIATYCKDKKISPAINIANNRFHGLVKELVDSFSSVLQS